MLTFQNFNYLTKQTMENITSFSVSEQDRVIQADLWKKALDKAQERAIIPSAEIMIWKRYMRLAISLLDTTPFEKNPAKTSLLLSYALYYLYITDKKMKRKSLDISHIIRFTWNKTPFQNPKKKLDDLQYQSMSLIQLWQYMEIMPIDFLDLDKDLIAQAEKELYRDIPKDVFYKMIESKNINMCQVLEFHIRRYLSRFGAKIPSWISNPEYVDRFLADFIQIKQEQLQNFIKQHLQAYNPLSEDVEIIL